MIASHAQAAEKLICVGKPVEAGVHIVKNTIAEASAISMSLFTALNSVKHLMFATTARNGLRVKGGTLTILHKGLTVFIYQRSVNPEAESGQILRNCTR